jgi:hypothetical protein
MGTFKVTIRAVVTKTLTVEAKDKDEACEIAHSSFSVMNNDDPEDYDEETVNVEEV